MFDTRGTPAYRCTSHSVCTPIDTGERSLHPSHRPLFVLAMSARRPFIRAMSMVQGLLPEEGGGVYVIVRGAFICHLYCIAHRFRNLPCVFSVLFQSLCFALRSPSTTVGLPLSCSISVGHEVVWAAVAEGICTDR